MDKPLFEDKKLRPVKEDGVVRVGGRAERWMQAIWNRQRFILLPQKHPISLLIGRYEHARRPPGSAGKYCKGQVQVLDSWSEQVNAKNCRPMCKVQEKARPYS